MRDDLALDLTACNNRTLGECRSPKHPSRLDARNTGCRSVSLYSHCSRYSQLTFSPGKTILASAIIDQCKLKAGFNTCYFYCHFDDQTSNSAVSIIKGLVDQILDKYPDKLPLCYVRRTSSGEPSLRSLNVAKKLLEDFCDTVPQLFVIIDGLDECEGVERKQILDVITNIVGRRDAAEPGKLRLLIVSQDYADIRKGLHSASVARMAPTILQITGADHEKNIQAYVRLYVNRIACRFDPFNDDLKEYLQNLTVSNAKGTLAASRFVPSIDQLNNRNVPLCQACP